MKNTLLASLTAGLVLAGAFSFHSLAEAAPREEAKRILIQHNGRIKPFDAFSRQFLELVSGKDKWQGQSASKTLMQALAKPQSIQDTAWVRMDYHELKSHLGLAAGKHHFSYSEVVPSLDKIESLVGSAKSKRDKDLRPTKLEQKAEALYGAMIEVRRFMSGDSIRVIPDAGDGPWISPYTSPQNALSEDFQELVAAVDENPAAGREKTLAWIKTVDEKTGGAFRQQADLEVHYLRIHPFQLAWIAYLLAFLFFTFGKKTGGVGGVIALSFAMFFHTYGLVLRVLILGRPPVSNMYESMVFMNWALMAAAVAFSLVRRQHASVSVGALISAIIMIYGNLLPIDTSLEVLVPVLRSNYWLTIHVLTIVFSYGLFGLAMGLGHRHIALELWGKMSKAESERSANLLHRIIQVGLLLLGIGTVLGGVWANESWGRFWGWDPKETWALITFLGYLIVMHLRYAKKISPFGLAFSSVAGFLLVLMTWYGVNFVLGRGLHSYGQGSGGLQWIIYYLIAEAAFLSAALFKKFRS